MLKVKVISLQYIFQVFYFLCFTRPRYQLSVYRTIGPLVSKFYRRHYELVSKFDVGLKSLLQQGLSEPEFYGDLVYKFKKK